jgi:hypothetical protein
LLLFVVGKVIDVTRVHVHGVDEAGGMGSQQMLLKRFDGHCSIVFEGQ